jgi:hypothetical protein
MPPHKKLSYPPLPLNNKKYERKIKEDHVEKMASSVLRELRIIYLFNKI